MLFGGYTDKMMISMLLRQLNSSRIDSRKLMVLYMKMSNRDALLFDYPQGETIVKMVDESGESHSL
jgi:hypothetical protein